MAQLAWKYFADEITEALGKVQQDLAPIQSGSIQQAKYRMAKSHRKSRSCHISPDAPKYEKSR